MKRKTRVWRAMALAAALCLSAGCAAACGNKEQPQGGARYTDEYLFQAGASDYAIVLPADCDDTLATAAEELRYFIREAGGADLKVTDDAGLTYSQNARFLSVGPTALASGAGVTPDPEQTGEDGFVIRTVGKSLFLAGGCSKGTLYAAYEFLERNLGVKIYAADEIVVPKSDSVKLMDLDLVERPSFELRSIGIFNLNYNGEIRRRLRTEYREEGWIYTSHSHFKILPPTAYRADHPDWYSADGTQLCMTNDEMRAEFTRRLIELVKNNPEAKYCMLGIEDFNTFCNCERCSPEIERYRESGVQIRFVNLVSRDVRAWLDEYMPGREFTLFCYAYFRTTEAPVEQLSNGTYRPLDPSVVPDPEVGVMIAPLTYPYSVALDDPDGNAAIKKTIEGWDAIMDRNLYMYYYGINYGDYQVPFDDYSTLKDNLALAKRIGSIGIFHLEAFNLEASAFVELRSYVLSNLLWDLEASPRQLTEEFILQYYGAGGPYVLQYYELMRMHYADLEQEIGFKAMPSMSSMDMLQAKYWPKQYLDRCRELLTAAEAAAAELSKTQPERSAELCKRIRKESISVRYLLLGIYAGRIPANELLSEIDSFERDAAEAGITEVRQVYIEGSAIAEIIAKWRAAAYARM